MTSPALEVDGLVKRYGATVAVDGLSLRADRGAVTALLGPNGAGKTTTVETCEGYRTPDAGVIRVLGLDPVRDAAALKPRLGVMLQDGVGYPGARVAEMLRLVASFARNSIPPDELVEVLGLQRVARTALRKISGGERQRLSLAMALVGRPEFALLDEPTSGLDVQARRATWDVVRRLRDDGGSVLLTTHNMDEAEQLADHIVIIDRGRVVADGTRAELTSGRAGSGRLRFRARPLLDRDGQLRAALPPGCTVSEPAPGEYVIDGPVDTGVVAALTAWCAGQGVLIDDLRTGGRSLEDVFVELTGRGLRE